MEAGDVTTNWGLGQRSQESGGQEVAQGHRASAKAWDWELGFRPQGLEAGRLGRVTWAREGAGLEVSNTEPQLSNLSVEGPLYTLQNY